MQIFPTRMCNVTAWRHSRLCAYWLMALREKYVFCVPPGITASLISLLSMGGVCGRSLMAGKILFTGRQTCSLYLVLWLCGCSLRGCIHDKVRVWLSFCLTKHANLAAFGWLAVRYNGEHWLAVSHIVPQASCTLGGCILMNPPSNWFSQRV